MLRTLFNLFMVLCFIFFFLSYSVSATFLVMAGLIALIAIARREADILDNWSALIRGAQGQGNQVVSRTKELILESKAPSVEMKEEKVGSGLVSTPIGETREFLIISDRRNTKLGNFKAFVNAADYGDGLFISWYLTYMPEPWQAVVSMIWGARKAAGLEDLNLFNKQDLTAYVTCVHHCLLDAVDKMMVGINQDPSKIDRRTKGFLGIS